MPETIQLTVTGMTCGGCEAAVGRALGQLPGVSTVSASHREARVEVTFDPDRVDAAQIRARIADLGYSVAA
jgi:copper chaperone CopZ